MTVRLPNDVSEDFTARCEHAAQVLDDRLHRYASAPQDWNLFLDVAWPLVWRQLTGRFPWDALPT